MLPLLFKNSMIKINKNNNIIPLFNHSNNKKFSLKMNNNYKYMIVKYQTVKPKCKIKF